MIEEIIKNYKEQSILFDEQRKIVEEFFSSGVQKAVENKDYKTAIDLWHSCPDVVTSVFICEYLAERGIIERLRYFQDK